LSRETIDQIWALCQLIAFFAVPIAVAYYTGSTVGFLALAAESLIGARISNGSDNGGFGYIFIMAMYAAFVAAIIWLVTGVT